MTGLISREDLINELIKYCDKDCYDGNVVGWCGHCNHDEMIKIVKRMPSYQGETGSERDYEIHEVGMISEGW